MKFSRIYTALFATLPVATVIAETNTVQLDEISVVAFRDPVQWAKSANSSSRLNKLDLQTSQSTSIADALKNITNVDISGGSRALAQKPTIRGLGGNRVVQVIDGVRQNFDLAHRGSYFIPPSLVQEVEVVKGPASTLWGSGALGGVVAMRTANALDLLKNDDKFGAIVRQGYQSANSQSETELSVFGATSSVDYLLSGFYNDSDNIRIGGSSEIPYSGLKQKGGLAKFGWQINDANRVELSHRLSLSKQTANSNNEAKQEITADDVVRAIGLYHVTCAPSCDISGFYSKIHNKFGSVNYISHQKVNDQNTTLNYYFDPESRYINSQITLFHNKTVEKEERVASGLKDETRLITKGFNFKNSSDLEWLGLTYGVDYYRDNIRTERETDETNNGKFRPNSYDAKNNVFGAYVLANIKLGEKFILSPSIRYDHYKTSSETQRYSDSNWSPATAFTWNATSWLDLTARYNEAYRAPSMQERFVSGAHFGMVAPGGMVRSNTFLTNPYLKPETAKNKELSASFHWNDLLTYNDKLQFNATYFQNDVKDFINLETFKSDPTNPAIFMPDISQYQNIANARLRGFELETNYQTERFAISLSYAQTRGKDRDTGEFLSNISADKLGLAVNYALVPSKFNVGARITRYSAQNRVPDDHGVTYPSYTLVGLTANYAPLKGEWENLRLDFAIENLFDRKYKPAFSLMEGTGRNIKVGASYYF